MKYCVTLAILCILFCSFCYAGTDSAGTSTIGGQEQTDVLTNGGDLKTDGGGLDLSGGDVANGGAVGATSVTATTVQADALRGATIDNPGGSTVGIADNVDITGQAGAVRYKVDDLTPDAAEDATSKYYVDEKVSEFKTWGEAEMQSGGGGATIYQCELNNVRRLSTTPLSGWTCSPL